MNQTAHEKILYPIDYHQLLASKELSDCVLKVIFEAHYREGGISCGPGFLFPTLTIGISCIPNPTDTKKSQEPDLTLEDSVAFDDLTPYIYLKPVRLHPETAPHWYSDCFVPSFFRDPCESLVGSTRLVHPGGDKKIFTMETLVSCYRNIGSRKDFSKFKGRVERYRVAYEKLVSPFGK